MRVNFAGLMLNFLSFIIYLRNLTERCSNILTVLRLCFNFKFNFKACQCQYNTYEMFIDCVSEYYNVDQICEAGIV